jgi:Domain of unknown function (DUF4326)
VLNKRHLEIDNAAVYVGRPTKFGNPFLIGRDGTRKEVVEKYRKWISESEQKELVQDIREELYGRDLICWCAPLACHADIILEIANS